MSRRFLCVRGRGWARGGARVRGRGAPCAPGAGHGAGLAPDRPARALCPRGRESPSTSCIRGSGRGAGRPALVPDPSQPGLKPEAQGWSLVLQEAFASWARSAVRVGGGSPMGVKGVRGWILKDCINRGPYYQVSTRCRPSGRTVTLAPITLFATMGRDYFLSAEDRVATRQARQCGSLPCLFQRVRLLEKHLKRGQ